MKSFTEEEIKILKRSRYIENVLPEEVVYGEAFEREYHRLRTEGKEPKDIFETLGLNIDIIGRKRIAEYHALYEERIHSNRDYEKEIEDTTVSERLKRLDREIDRMDHNESQQ